MEQKLREKRLEEAMRILNRLVSNLDTSMKSALVIDKITNNDRVYPGAEDAQERDAEISRS